MDDLKRDPSYIKERLVNKGGKITCKENCVIEFPSWYLEKDMAQMAELVSFFGIFVIIMGDKYSVSLIPVKVTSNPLNITTIERDGVVYTRLEYKAGDEVIHSDSLVQDTLLSYEFYNNFVIYSRIPWFINQLDLNKVFSNLPYYAASNVGDNVMTNELTTSVVTRSAKDPDTYYRQIGSKGPYRFVALTNLFYSVDGTVSKITGSYTQVGILSALTKKPKAEEASDFEKHLMG